MYKIFIDGASGTTGLELKELLKPWQKSGEIEIISIKNHRNKKQRRAAFEEADLSVLCLNDDVTKETMALLEGTKTRILDTSSINRTKKGWVYGFPEMNEGQADRISKARFVTNPGCFATGAIAILRPLIDAGIIDKRETIAIFGVAGYSSGGKSLIKKFEDGNEEFSVSNVFAASSINAQHKHVKEIKRYSGLKNSPIFLPHVINAPRGMMVSIAFNLASSKKSLEDIQQVYKASYESKESKVSIVPLDLSDKRLNFADFASINANPKNSEPLAGLKIHVKGWNTKNDCQANIFATFDNLGKGASTQAMQNIRLMLGLQL